jgi:hypothetical protein
MICGYPRALTDDQSVDAQVKPLRAASGPAGYAGPPVPGGFHA